MKWFQQNMKETICLTVMHAIAAKKELPGRIRNSIIGYLPKEIYRITRYIILYGAMVNAKSL